MNKKGYFDYNATTPMCCEATQAFHQAVDDFGNPSSKYGLAKSSRGRLKLARLSVARLLGADSSEVFFTSGGTESNNWAIKGTLIARGACGEAAAPAHVVISEIEHSSVLEVAAFLERVFGCEVSRLKPDSEGRISTAAVLAALRPNTQLVSIMLVNNEVGTMQPVEKIAPALRARGIHFHVDAVQAVGKVPVDVRQLGVDTLAFAAHKFYGPKGVGGLYIRQGIAIEPLIHGGGQEKGLRGGTEAVTTISAMGAAAEASYARLPEQILKLTEYRELLRARLLEQVHGIAFNGPVNRNEQAPNTLSVRVDGIRAEALAAMLDNMHGIQVSLGSACSNNKSITMSHVLQAMGLSEAQIKATLRISIGQYTDEAGVDSFVRAMADGVRLLQRIGSGERRSDGIAA